jgi:hypothetical protein
MTNRPDHLQPPTFSLRRLFAAIACVCVGLGGIAFHYRQHRLYDEGQYRQLVFEIDSVPLTASFVFGLTCATIGVIILCKPPRAMRVLMLTLIMVLVAAIVSHIVDPGPRRFKGEPLVTTQTVVFYILVSLAAVVTPLIVTAIDRVLRRRANADPTIISSSA